MLFRLLFVMFLLFLVGLFLLDQEIILKLVFKAYQGIIFLIGKNVFYDCFANFSVILLDFLAVVAPMHFVVPKHFHCYYPNYCFLDSIHYMRIPVDFHSPNSDLLHYQGLHSYSNFSTILDYFSYYLHSNHFASKFGKGQCQYYWIYWYCGSMLMILNCFGSSTADYFAAIDSHIAILTMMLAFGSCESPKSCFLFRVQPKSMYYFLPVKDYWSSNLLDSGWWSIAFHPNYASSCQAHSNSTTFPQNFIIIICTKLQNQQYTRYIPIYKSATQQSQQLFLILIVIEWDIIKYREVRCRADTFLGWSRKDMAHFRIQISFCIL